MTFSSALGLAVGGVLYGVCWVFLMTAAAINAIPQSDGQHLFP